MEELTSNSTKVKELSALRSKIIAKLEKCELDIADAECRYLEETDHGNIVKGFDGAQNRKVRVRSKDRLFSRSSLTAPLGDEDELPFQTQHITMDAMLSMLTGGETGPKKQEPTLLAASSLLEDKSSTAAPPVKRRRSAVPTADIVATPTKPEAVKMEEDFLDSAQSGVVTRRSSKRNKK